MAKSAAQRSREYRARKKIERLEKKLAGLEKRPRSSRAVDLDTVRQALYDIVVSEHTMRDSDRISAARVLLTVPEIEDTEEAEAKLAEFMEAVKHGRAGSADGRAVPEPGSDDAGE